MKTLLTLALFGLCATAVPQRVDNSAITSLDMKRYLGQWYEIARYDHSFERDLVGCTAEYSMRGDGKIKVLNSGYLKRLDGPYKESIGKAKSKRNGAAGQPAASSMRHYLPAFRAFRVR